VDYAATALFPLRIVSGVSFVEGDMASYQWFLLGMVAAWMLSLAAIVVLLPRSRKSRHEDSIQGLSDT
jgi:hypothetical protein